MPESPPVLKVIGISLSFRNENDCRNERRNGFSFSSQQDERRSGVYPMFHSVPDLTMVDITSRQAFPFDLNQPPRARDQKLLWQKPSIGVGCSSVAPSPQGSSVLRSLSSR